MKLLLLVFFCVAVVVAQPAKTRIQAVTESLHGVSITDPYRWLEDQSAPETRAWIDNQMKYTESVLSKLPQREHIKQRLGELMKIDAMGAPAVRNGRYFFSKRRADQNQAVVYTRQGLDGPDTVLIDPNPMTPDHTMSAQLMGVRATGNWSATDSAKAVRMKRRSP